MVLVGNVKTLEIIGVNGMIDFCAKLGYSPSNWCLAFLCNGVYQMFKMADMLKCLVKSLTPQSDFGKKFN